MTIVICVYMRHLQMIAAHYEEDPESFNDEIKQLDQLREVSLFMQLLADREVSGAPLAGWPIGPGPWPQPTPPVMTLYQQKPYLVEKLMSEC